MSFLRLKKILLNQVIAVFQVLLLLSYFTLNIINVGEMGTALSLLIGFFILAGVELFLRLLRGYLSIKLYFLVFLIFVAWLSFRVLIDLQDIERLKQTTVATTGGVLLFFLLGALARRALNTMALNGRLGLVKWGLAFFTISSVFVFFDFQPRLSRSDILFIEDVDGGYQRPGNFMIMLFLMASFLYLSIAAHFQTKRPVRLLLWLVVYSVGMLFSLISSQMIGSNAATANILAIYLMAVVFSFLVFSVAIRRDFLNGNLALPLSKSSLKKIMNYSLCVALISVFVASVVMQITEFDLNKTRVFGFGTGENNSINSRIEILKETGIDQVGYSPFLGSVDVARLTTGETGKTLHSFIPNVIAELGFFGLCIIVLLFSLFLRSLIKEMKPNTRNEHGFILAMLSFWLLFVFVFLFIYANLAVGKEWPVMWFFLGISACVITDKTGRNLSGYKWGRKAGV